MTKDKDPQTNQPLSDPALAGDPAELLARAEQLLAQATAFAESAKAAATAALASQQQLDAALADVKTKAVDVATIASRAMAADSQINDAQAVIAKKSEHIEEARKHADTVRVALDTANTSASKQATDAEGHRTRAQSAADEAAKQLAAVRVVKGSADTDATAIAAARELAEKSAAATKSLAEKATSIQERITAYEKQLVELNSQCAAQLDEITRLLPGAASAGLATAWDKRSKTFIQPAKRWQWLFIGSVVSLTAVAAEGLIRTFLTNTILGYDEIYRLWLTRGPVAGALIWLAMYASRESALAKRLEEDYAYKSAAASSFQGFQKQMSEIGASAGANTPLAKLCVDTLTTIGNPPGRIYDKHRLTVSPAEHLTDAAKVVGGARKE